MVVVNLLLLSTRICSNALPTDVLSTPLKEDRQLEQKTNTTWTRNRSKSTDTPIKDFSFKESIEEDTDKNVRYKKRGTVKFNTKPSTESYLRRVRSTEASKLVIVTPTPEIKKSAEIIDSMRTYKKSKTPAVISSTAPMPIKNEVHSEEEYEDEEDEEEKETFEKFTSSKFDENSFFTLPSFDFDDTKGKEDYSSPSYGYSSFFPKEASYGFKNSKNSDRFNPDSFFDFDTDLTTPKNDFFDKKYKEISGNIIKNLDEIKVKASPPNVTNVHKIVKGNAGLEELKNNTPTNKSTVFIKNTKEIRLSDNEEAGSAENHLSDVQGTSIYYEMSVLSTETYTINHFTDDDCDNDTFIAEPTIGTTLEEELAPIKSTQQTLKPVSTKASRSLEQTFTPLSTKEIEVTDSEPDAFSTIVSLLPVSSVLPIFSASPLPASTQNSIPYVTQNTVPISTQYSIPYSTQNSFISTDKSTRIYSNSYNRNRSYSKRLNLSGVKDPNSVTINPDGVSNDLKLPTRKFHHTTPKNRPIWMHMPRNVTKVYTRPTNPTTIYSEHFNIKNKFTTTQKPNRTILTTVSSEIDPVLESEVGGLKKIVHSKKFLDNSIPSLMKRGSTKFTTSTASTEVENISDLEIPPTLAFALATLKSLPPLPTTITNVNTTNKNVDENELQKVGDVIGKMLTSYNLVWLFNIGTFF